MLLDTENISIMQLLFLICKISPLFTLNKNRLVERKNIPSQKTKKERK